MRRLFYILAVVTIPFIQSCDSKPPSVSQCDTHLIKTGINAWIDSLRSYDLSARVVVKEAQVDAVSHITGKRPDRLKIRLGMRQGAIEVRQLTVFDGNYQWVESKSKFATDAVKIKLASLTSAERPFDTSYHLIGTGLFSGEDFPSTIETYLAIYDTNVKCLSQDKVQVYGTINPHAFKQYIQKSLFAKAKIANFDRFLEAFPHLRMDFNAKDFSLLSYGLGTVSDETIQFSIEKMTVNRQIADSEFTYVPPADVNVEDITQQIKSMW